MPDQWESGREGGETLHPELISSVNEDMPDEEMLYDLAELFRIFGDSTRIKILYVLFEAEMCVCDIAELLHMTQVQVSRREKKLLLYLRQQLT